MPATLSKDVAPGPICSKVLHPFLPVCTPGPIYLRVGFTEALKLYGPLFFLTAVLSRRIFSPSFVVTKLLPSVIRSSAVIGVFGGLYGYLSCKLTQLGGRPTPLNQFMAPFLAGIGGILIEKAERRSELALYMANNAADALYRVLVGHRVPFFRYYKHGLTFVFAVAMAVLCVFKRFEPSVLGNSERVFIDGVVGIDSAPDRLETFVARRLDAVRRALSFKPVAKLAPSSPLCAHRGDCAHHSELGFVKGFLIGYMLKAALGLLPTLMAFRAWRSPTARQRILSKCFGRAALESGLFLGLLSGGTRAMRCLLRAVRGRDDGINQFIAAFVGSFSFTFSNSVEIAMYFASKAADTCYRYLQQKGYVRPVPYGHALLFAASTGIMLAVSFWEPHNVRPGYISYLRKATGGHYPSILAASHALKLEMLTGSNRDAYINWFNTVFKPKFGHKLGAWAAHIIQ
eukprot:TRINITY_DN24157_c0_g1_i1.p1 TRINITY_DN24157_c0_g1~~TRINITY_DN24157_c0_g1_i1.p1  ORF type:complete len:458 (-),score=112.08 TRINITY_DN24157_c0_g1_i1:505-1878(-)